MNLFRFLLVFSVFIALNGYLFIRGWQAMPDKVWVHMIYTVLFLFSSLSVFIAIFLGNRLPLWLSLVFEQVGGYYIILFIFIFAGALLGDLLRASDHYFRVFPEWVTTNYPRAKLLYFFTVISLLGIISLIGFSRFSNPGIVELDLSINTGGSQEEMTLVAASDIHLGNVIRKGRLAEWVDLINNQHPDLILLAGDIFDHSYKSVEMQQMDQELSRLYARHGVYAVPGNHDYYAGIEQVLAYLKKSGIKVLRDQSVTIDNRILLIGRDDLTNRNRKPLDSLLIGMNNNLPRVLLDHQPLSLQESVDNRIDLHISGHTHNGQIFPFNRIVSKIYELGYGYKKTGTTHFYVSSGLGLWGAPIRLGTQSEIVIIRLNRELN
jgi:predicted MPP superfamily phosphohydrolase